MAIKVRIPASFTALIVLLGLLLVITPLLEFHSGLRLGVGSLTMLCMGAAAWRLHASRWIRGAMVGMGLLGVSAAVAQFADSAEVWVVVLHATVTAFVLLVGGTIAVSVWQTTEVDVDTIVGGIAVYLLLAIAFSNAFQLLEFVAPGSFVAVVEDSGRWGPWETNPGVFPRLFFLSFVTLTTLGYGDVIPASASAAGLVSLEAVIGPIFLAVLIARLVGMHAAGGGPSTGGSEPRG